MTEVGFFYVTRLDSAGKFVSYIERTRAHKPHMRRHARAQYTHTHTHTHTHARTHTRAHALTHTHTHDTFSKEKEIYGGAYNGNGMNGEGREAHSSALDNLNLHRHLRSCCGLHVLEFAKGKAKGPVGVTCTTRDITVHQGKQQHNDLCIYDQALSRVSE